MSAPKLLIPLDYLTEACFLSVNNSDKKYKMALKLAQDQLKAVLGREFYEEIETQYDAQADTFTAPNDTLYEDYIKDYLAWETYAFYVRFSQGDDTPTGLREFKEENSELLSDIKLSAREKNIQGSASFYKNELINFLRESQANDSTAYPLWTECVNAEFNWGISGVSLDGEATRTFSINKAVTNNQ